MDDYFQEDIEDNSISNIVYDGESQVQEYTTDIDHGMLRRELSPVIIYQRP